MKNYKDALLALDLGGTPTAIGNKFAKIGHNTEDPVLKELCLKLSQWCGWHLKPGYSRQSKDPNTGQPINVGKPKTRQEWISGRDLLVDQIRSYCTGVVSQGKPEWMRLAEKHGWRPPN